jgi:hypothetical protein
MRVAIIIVGVIGLIFLGIKWDSLSPTQQEGTIIKEQKADRNPTCPKCDKDVEIIRLENDEKRKFCKTHGMVAVNF